MVLGGIKWGEVEQSVLTAVESYNMSRWELQWKRCKQALQEDHAAQEERRDKVLLLTLELMSGKLLGVSSSQYSKFQMWLAVKRDVYVYLWRLPFLPSEVPNTDGINQPDRHSCLKYHQLDLSSQFTPSEEPEPLYPPFSEDKHYLLFSY